MARLLDIGNPQIFQVANGNEPDKNGKPRGYSTRAFHMELPFALDSVLLLDLVTFTMRGEMDAVRSMFVDNSASSVPLIARGTALNIAKIIPAYSQGYLPVEMPNAFLQLESASGLKIDAQFFNYDIGASTWSALAPSNSPTGGTVRTPSLANPTGAGTVAAGTKSVSIANVGAANGTVLGVALLPGSTATFEATGADTLAAIAYDATGTTFQIASIV